MKNLARYKRYTETQLWQPEYSTGRKLGDYLWINDYKIQVILWDCINHVKVPIKNIIKNENRN